jgi:hypothetical protein
MVLLLKKGYKMKIKLAQLIVGGRSSYVTRTLERERL